MLVTNCVQYEQGQSVYRLYKYALQCIVFAEGVCVYSVSLLVVGVVVRVVSVSLLVSLPDSLILLILCWLDSLSRISLKRSFTFAIGLCTL